MTLVNTISRFLDTYRRRYLTVGSLTALAIASGLGLYGYFRPESGLPAFARYFDPIVSQWVALIKVIVVPLIVAYLLVAIVSIGTARETGKLGGLTVLVHTLIALVALACALLASKYIIPLADSNIEPLRPHLKDLVVPDISDRGTEPIPFWDGIIAQVWVNPLTAVRRGQVLPLLFWTLVVAFGLKLVRQDVRERVVRFFEKVVAVGQFAVAVLLLVMPVVVFGLVFSLVVRLGLEVLGAVGFYVVAVSALAAFVILLLYLLTPLVTRIPIREFAKALVPSQVIAIGSRSSVVCLPTLIEAAENRLHVDRKVSEFVLPLSVSTFKVSRATTTPFKFFFLVYLFGVDLDPTVAFVFIAAEFGLSYGSPGLPSGSFLVMLPVYIAAGIPVEGYALLLAVDAIPDVFKTLLNVSEDLALVAIVQRLISRKAGPAPFVAGAAPPAG